MPMALAAWDAVDAMNNLAGEALVERSSGGRGGGSTRLTARGRQLVERFDQIEAVHRRFVHMLSSETTDLVNDLNLLRLMTMKTSARNQFSGAITALRRGAVNDEVEITVGQATRIIATVTSASTESLGLAVGSQAFALVKATSIIIATDLEQGGRAARGRRGGAGGAGTPGAGDA